LRSISEKIKGVAGDGETMDSRSSSVVVCASVLGRFGVSADTVADDARSPEAAVEAAIERAPSRTAFLRRTISTAPRGIDASARYARETPWRQLRTTFEALGWSFDAEDRSGRSVERAASPTGPFSVTVADADGRRRTATVEYPQTPLGRYNLPALLARIERKLLYGVDWRFVALSDGADRWRFAPVEADALAALRDAHGDRVEPFGRPLLARHGPTAYEPDGGPGVWPDWARETASTDDGATAGGPTADVDTADVIDFVGGSDPGDDESDSTEDSDGETVLRDGVAFDGLSDWSAAESSSEEPTPEATGDGVSGASETDASTDDAGTDDTAAFTVGGSPKTVRSTDEESAGADAASGRGPETDSATEPQTDDGDDEFFDGGLSGGPSVERVENESFGLPESQTDEESLQAAGVAIDAGGGVSVAGLLDDESFLPTIPASGPTEVRLSFDTSFEPAAPAPVETPERDDEDEFVWVNADGLGTSKS